LRQRQEIQEMSRSLVLVLTLGLGAGIAASAADLLPARLGSFVRGSSHDVAPPDPSVFAEFGFVSSESAEYRGAAGKGTITAYRMRDTTGAFAAWDWLRTANSHHCAYAEHCAQDGKRYMLLTSNYVVEFENIVPNPTAWKQLETSLPGKRPGDLPPVLSFVPINNLVPNSSRYILGPESLRAVAPELLEAKPGFSSEGAEAHYSAYKLGGAVVKLALFDYASPEMARLHVIDFKGIPGAVAKRSGVLVAVVLPGAPEKQAQELLDQIQYRAKILWNEPPPPSPLPPLYRLLVNIVILSAILSALALAAGLIYAAMRIYRRRYGTLDEEEAMTTLRLSGD
jgi:Family of unknown function (DUF6599)